MHALGAERLDRERRRQRRVDPAREADHDVAEAVLVDVVAQAELEREPHLLEVVERRRRLGRATQLVLRARRGRARARRRRARRALARERAAAHVAQAPRRPRSTGSTSTTSSASSKPGARATSSPSSSSTTEWPSKISSSWPPTSVAEGDEARVVARADAEHLLALAVLADVERRGGDVDDELRAGEREVGRRRAGLPDVLADRRRRRATSPSRSSSRSRPGAK